MKRTNNGDPLEKVIQSVLPPDSEAMRQAAKRWDSIAKPLRSLGAFENMITQIAGIQRSVSVALEKRTLVVFCSDNGIVEEGVTQTGQDVTAVVASNLAHGRATAALFCRRTGTDILPVDVGMITDVGIRTEKAAYGTKNFAKTDAMTRAQAIKTIGTGAAIARELADAGNRILMTGEMGIGNTSTSSAVAAVLLGRPVEEITGRGAGLSDEGLRHKREVLSRAVRDRNPDPSDPLDVLAKTGGFDIAAMAGLMIGAASCKIPVILDGFISAVAALTAVRMCPQVFGYLIPSHQSSEPGANIVLEALGLRAPLHADMRPGEGCGAVMMIPLLELAADIYTKMPTFEEIEIEAYQSFDEEVTE
ncbi:MAG: nicotinate-nucleotide--dimethylbenzimidazole phosphoribosyltransferase [Eubacterium sp.]|nr:nicotinate-nucleotide--dimethylbenzimidazole phosphoribosyltransferase [Eubacterium sp.]